MTFRRDSPDFTQGVIDALPEPLVVIDPEHRVVLVNRAAREALGGASELDENLRCHSLLHGSSEPCTGDESCPLEQVRQTGKPVTVTHRHLTRGGQTRLQELEISPLCDPEGKFAGVVQLARDVTDRTRLQEQLSRAKSEWEKTFDAIPDLVFIRDADHRILRLNRALARRLGKEPAEIAGLRCYEAIFGDEPCPESCPCADPAAVQGREIREAYDRKLGGHFLVSSTEIRDAQGSFLGVVTVARDVTELEAARQTLIEERNRLAAVLESIGDAVLATDADCRVTLLNRVAESLTGMAAGDAIGRPVSDVVLLQSGVTLRPCPSPVDEALRTGCTSAVLGGARLVSPDGSERMVEAKASPIRDQRGEVVGAVLALRDVTEKELAEIERARAQHLESLGVLAGGIAHDFNNILMAIVGNIALAQKELSPESRGYRRLAEAEGACFHARDLTQQLLTFARGGELVKRVFSLAHRIEEWAAFVLRGTNVRPEVVVHPGLPPVEADESQIHQVMSNLVLNARQATPRGGIVRIRADGVAVGPESRLPLPPGPYVRIAVEDEGVGIAPEHLHRIFEPYFTTKQTGSGLGLSTAYAIVRRHGGHIAVSSELGRGSTFSVYLPASGEPVRAQESLPVEPQRGSGRVLVMDDEEMIRSVLAELLPELGYEAEFASEGSEAVEKYLASKEQGRPFDVVILDLTVPGGMGGIETLARLREADPAVRAIASSGYASTATAVELARHGFAATIPKPYRTSDLARALREASRPPAD